MLNKTDEVLEESLKAAKEFMPMQKKDIVVLTGGFPNTGIKKTTNLMKIEEI